MIAEQSPPFDIYVAAGLWAERDGAGFGNWLNRLPSGDLYDVGVKRMANQLSKEGDMESAIEWAMTVSQDNRGSAMSSVGGKWAQRDPAGLRAWLETAELSKSDRRRMEQYLKGK